MKSALFLHLLLFILFLTSCAPESSLVTPSPEQLVNDPRYKDQVIAIDRQREREGKETLTDLVEQKRITKTPTGKEEPIVIEIDEEVTEDEKKRAQEEGILDVVHDRIQLEEYFIIDGSELPVNESTPPALDTLPKDKKPEPDPEEKTEKAKEPEEEPAPPATDKIDNEDIDVPFPPKRPKPHTTEDEDVTPYAPAEAPLPPKKKTPPVIHSREEISTFKARWDRNPQGALYTKYILDALEAHGSKLLDATNIKDAGYCARLNSLSRDEKKQFWLMFISGIARWESGFDSTGYYLEPTSGRYSRGLLQLDYLTTTRYPYYCPFSSEYDIHTAKKNLYCGVKMITHLVLRDKTVRRSVYGVLRDNKGKIKRKADGSPKKGYTWYGASAYWSVLRPEIWSGEKKRTVLTIPAYTKKLSFCSN